MADRVRRGRPPRSSTDRVPATASPRVALVAALVAGAAAQLAGLARAEASEPATVVRTAVEVGFGQDDNPTLLQDGGRAARFVVVAPSLTLQRTDRDARTEASLRAEMLRHDGRSELDRANLELGIGAVHALGTHAAAAWRLTLQDWHDPVGSSSLARTDDKPDHFVAGAAGLVLRQDALDDSVRLEAELALSRKQYQNHREVTVLGDLSTRAAVLRMQKLGEPGRVLWLAEWRSVAADYPFRPAGLSHEDHRVNAGLQVDAVPGDARPWSLQARLGWQRLGFSGLRPTVRAPVWELQAQWLPLPGAQVDASAQRQQLVAPGDLADVLRAEGWRLGWTQAWAGGFSASLVASGTRIAYRYGGFADGEDRLERLRSMEVSLRRALAGGWAVSGAALHATRRADVDGHGYRRRVWRLALDWSG